MAAGSPARMMFDIFRKEFASKTFEKMEELMKFNFKPNESLKAAYYRLSQLIRDTGMRSDQDAAEDYMAALPP